MSRLKALASNSTSTPPLHSSNRDDALPMSSKVITLGDRHHAVGINEVLAILEDPKINLNVNLLSIPLADRRPTSVSSFPAFESCELAPGAPLGHP
jgi:hypothetical protein